ncbi:MAG: glycerate dehydrogenase, partial [Thiolinea sp.]
MPATVFLDFASTSRDDLDLQRLEATCSSLTLWPHTTLEQRLEHIGAAEVVISNKVVLDAPLLEQLQGQLKLICVAATGTNNIDLQTAQKFSIPVTNVRNYANRSVAEHTLALVFNLGRRITAYQQSTAQGDWSRSPFFCLLDHPITELAG